MFYINWNVQPNLSLCALRKYDCFGLELGTGEREAPVEFMHVPQPCACALSCLCCECRRPQQSATVRCLEWADVYSPPYRVLKDMGWHVAAVQPACLTDCALTFPKSGGICEEGWATVCYSLAGALGLSFINTVAGTCNRQGFLCGCNTVYQQINVKKTRKC